MNRKYKRGVQSLLVNDMCWLLLRPFVYVAKRLLLSRENYINRKQEDENIAVCKKIFAQEEVMNGPFKGLNFKGIEATGSSIYAKLLGSYEMELAPLFSQLLTKKYDHCINVGCDEGYYAVGIAQKIPGIKVIAFDCNKVAQERCKALATLNQVQEHITVKGCFSFNDIVAVDSNTLFVIDCEGCENETVTQELINQFAAADFIIELHYEQAPLVLSKLQQLFVATHSVNVINALSDHERVIQYRFPELEDLSYEQRKFILEERTGFMQWLIARPINYIS